jgi:flagellin-like protein
MNLRREGWRHHRRTRGGVANIIATVLMIAITVAAGTILWEFSLHLPAAPPSITLSIRSGTSNPVWGDPSDCLPWMPAWLNYNTHVTTSSSNTTADYILSGGTYSVNPNTRFGNWWNHGLSNLSGGTPGLTLYYNECSDLSPPGDFSVMNTTLFIVSSHTPSLISLASIQLLFLCNGSAFIQGTLAAMTWYPGSQSQPAPNAPHLGNCGTYVPSGAYSTLYNRFGIFVPLNTNVTALNNGDTFIMYVHTSSPFDPDLTGYNRDPVTHVDCGPAPDCDDYHGAPPWCFTTPLTATTGCALDFYTTGTSPTLLASIPLFNLIR